jgi:glycosidase
MQWKNEPNAGFSKSAPWLPVPASYATHNVEVERKDPGSILNFYKRILALRHSHPALLEGAYVPLNQDDPNVLSYLRTYKGKAVLVVLNMSGTDQKITFDLAKHGFIAAKLQPLAVSDAEVADSGVHLQPFGAFVGEVVK